MTRLAPLAAIIALALAAGAGAAGSGSLSATPTSLASGDSFTVTACVATAGDGGYLLVKGPNTFGQDLFFSTVTSCTSFPVSTNGWAAGKYRINGFEFTTKGTKGIGSVTITVSQA